MDKTYLVYGKRLVVVYYTDLDGICKVQYRALFNLQNILDRERYLYTVPVVMSSENDLLNRSGPFLRTRSTVCFENISSFVRCYCKTSLFFAFFRAFKYFGSQGVLEIDAISRKVEFCWVGVICEYVATQDEPVSVQLRSATLEEITCFGDIMLLNISKLQQLQAMYAYMLLG